MLPKQTPPKKPAEQKPAEPKSTGTFKPLGQKPPAQMISNYRKRQQVTPFIVWGGVVFLVVLGIILLIVWLLGGNGPKITLFATETPTPTITPSPTSTNTPTSTPTETSTPTITPSPTPSAPFEYVVEDGDNLYAISEKFELGGDGIPLLFLLNPTVAENDGIVSVGQTILIPNPGMQLPTETPLPTGLPRGTEVEYVIQSGDTLEAIANKFNSTVDDIMAKNQLDNPNALFVGQKLLIRINLVTPTITPNPTITPGATITPGGTSPEITPTWTPAG